MKIDTKRARELDLFINNHPELEVKELKVPVELGGNIQYLSVWRIPTKMLIYNIRNGRFAAELLV